MVDYTDISPSQLGRIKPLWMLNKEFHEAIEPIFCDQYASLVFEDRMDAIASGCDAMRITIAEENASIIGYCISTVKGALGEVASLHVHVSQRGRGIGKHLLALHIDWLKRNGCSEIGLYVSPNNGVAIELYKSQKLYPNILYMQLKE